MGFFTQNLQTKNKATTFLLRKWVFAKRKFFKLNKNIFKIKNYKNQTKIVSIFQDRFVSKKLSPIKTWIASGLANNICHNTIQFTLILRPHNVVF